MNSHKNHELDIWPSCSSGNYQVNYQAHMVPTGQAALFVSLWLPVLATFTYYMGSCGGSALQIGQHESFWWSVNRDTFCPKIIFEWKWLLLRVYCQIEKIRGLQIKLNCYCFGEKVVHCGFSRLVKLGENLIHLGKKTFSFFPHPSWYSC